MIIKNKTINIVRKEYTSAFFRKNKQFVTEGNWKIGSSVSAEKNMSAQSGEFQRLIAKQLGLTLNSPDLEKRIVQYWQSISRNVPAGQGLVLDVSFRYDKEDKFKSDYIKELGIKTENDISKHLDEMLSKIEKDYLDADKSSEKLEEEAFKEKYRKLIEYEDEKLKLGTPTKTDDYFLYRYCLVYKDVANRIEDINKSQDIRFYIYDNEVFKKNEEESFNIKIKAEGIFHKIISDDAKVANIVKLFNHRPTDKITNLKTLRDIIEKQPEKFIKIEADKQLQHKGFIEDLITFNILRRLPNSTMIVDEENNTIGETLNDAVTYITAEKNKAYFSSLENKLKSILK